MTRIGFFLFNSLLVALVYGLAWLEGAKPAVVLFLLQSFSEPYVLLILLMTVFNTIRWFMNHDPEVGREIVTWLNALWSVPAMTALAIYLLGGMRGDFGISLQSLLTLR